MTSGESFPEHTAMCVCLQAWNQSTCAILKSTCATRILAERMARACSEKAATFVSARRESPVCTLQTKLLLVVYTLADYDVSLRAETLTRSCWWHANEIFE